MDAKIVRQSELEALPREVDKTLSDSSITRELTATSLEQDSYYDVDGFRMYSKRLENADPMVISKLQDDLETEFHLLRHFSNVPETYRASIRGKGFTTQFPEPKETIITDALIDQALATSGSKFDPSYLEISTPRDLIQFVKEQALLRAASSQGLMLFDGGFCQKAVLSIDMGKNIGTDAVSAISEEGVYENLARGMLNGDAYMVKALRGQSGPETNSLTIVIGIIDGSASIFTAFPGKPAPPFPNDKLAPAERQYAEHFWSTHALII